MDRHIYNHSNQPWTFQVNFNVGPNHGNVYFSGDGSGTAQNGPWVVPPQGTAAIQYTSTGGKSAGTLVITDHTGSAQLFNYGVNTTTEGGSISHSGNTGAANLNDPANCDITMGQDQW